MRTYICKKTLHNREGKIAFSEGKEYEALRFNKRSIDFVKDDNGGEHTVSIYGTNWRQHFKLKRNGKQNKS